MDASKVLKGIYRRFRGQEYTRGEVAAIREALAPLTDAEYLDLEGRLLGSKEFLPTVRGWQEAAREAVRRRGGGLPAPETEDCPSCHGSGTVALEVLCLDDGERRGAWTVACPRGCRPSVAGIPRGAAALAAFFLRSRRIGASSLRVGPENVVCFPSVADLEAWRRENPEAICRKVRLPPGSSAGYGSR